MNTEVVDRLDKLISLLEEQYARRPAQKYARPRIDVIKFINDCCMADNVFTTTGAIYSKYCQYCNNKTIKPLSKVAIGRALKKLGYSAEKRMNVRGWFGIALR